jgi:uncharacterized protein (DUF2267 family)
MSTTSLDVFDRTLQKTNIWLNQIMDIMGWEDRHTAYTALRATLHALRDRLTVQEAAQLAAQLPMLIRGIYYEGWNPTHTPVPERHLDQFLARIEREFRSGYQVDPEEVARAVFKVLATRVTEGEISDVEQVLPAEVKTLWTGVRAMA